MIDCSECDAADATVRVFGDAVMIALCDACAGELERDIAEVASADR